MLFLLALVVLCSLPFFLFFFSSWGFWFVSFFVTVIVDLLFGLALPPRTAGVPLDSD